MGISLSQLKTKCRQRSDQENSTHVGEDELTGYLNDSILKFYDLVNSVDATYFEEQDTSITTDGTNDAYDLPSDFYKLLSVDAQIGGEWKNVDKFSRSTRNHDASGSTVSEFSYRIRKDKIIFNPKPQSGISIRLNYVPQPTVLSDADDEFNFTQFTEFIVVDTAIKMKDKEESDVTLLLSDRTDLEDRIKNHLNRDDYDNDTIYDTWDNEYEEYA